MYYITWICALIYILLTPYNHPVALCSSIREAQPATGSLSIRQQLAPAGATGKYMVTCLATGQTLLKPSCQWFCIWAHVATQWEPL